MVLVINVIIQLFRCVIVFGIGSINVLLCGMCNFILNSIDRVFVYVDFIMSVGIMWNGFWVV